MIGVHFLCILDWLLLSILFLVHLFLNGIKKEFFSDAYIFYYWGILSFSIKIIWKGRYVAFLLWQGTQQEFLMTKVFFLRKKNLFILHFYIKYNNDMVHSQEKQSSLLLFFLFSVDFPCRDFSFWPFMFLRKYEIYTYIMDLNSEW